MNFEKDLSAQILYANENIKTTELNSLIYFLNGLTDDEFDRIFSGSQDDSINLNFNELVNIYYNILPVKIPNRRSRRYRKNINKRCFARESIDHFRDVVNEFINYIKNDYGLILENTK